MMKLAPRVVLLLSTVAAVSVGLSAEAFPSTYQVPPTCAPQLFGSPTDAAMGIAPVVIVA